MIARWPRVRPTMAHRQTVVQELLRYRSRAGAGAATVARRRTAMAARTEEFYEGDRDTVLSAAGLGETMQEVLARRWSRRGMLRHGTGRPWS
jgi:hypothetical protein